MAPFNRLDNSPHRHQIKSRYIIGNEIRKTKETNHKDYRGHREKSKTGEGRREGEGGGGEDRRVALEKPAREFCHCLYVAFVCTVGTSKSLTELACGFPKATGGPEVM